jgi:hypothetical protein
MTKGYKKWVSFYMSKSSVDKGVSIETFVSRKRGDGSGRVKAAIEQRWNTRIIPRGLDKLGRDGARLYIESYGKGISAGKLVELAICGEVKGAPEVAAGFWEAAYLMETGVSNEYGGGAEGGGGEGGEGGRAGLMFEGIPADMQPGMIHTMQAVDADQDRQYYIENDDYYGQPKRDGFRNVLFANSSTVAHQSRSTTVLPSINRDLESAIKRVAKAVGPFVLDGERYYMSATGSEHRTAAQAALANLEAGRGEIQPVVVYGVFKALYAGWRDLRAGDEDTRITAGSRIVAMVEEVNTGDARIEFLDPAKTAKEKQKLTHSQLSDGREGEIWVHKNSPYSGGKGHRRNMVRTKYVTETVYKIVSISMSDSKKGVVASIEVADDTGEVVGSVGSGFDKALSRKLIEAHRTNPERTRVLVRHQGKTEHGKLWHARVLETC